MSICASENPASARALADSFTATTAAQWAAATARHAAAYDSDCLVDDLADHAPAILAALAAGDNQRAGAILATARADTIARRVNFELTGSTK